MENFYVIKFNEKAKKISICKVYWSDSDTHPPEPPLNCHYISFLESEIHAIAYRNYFESIFYEKTMTKDLLLRADEELSWFLDDYNKKSL